MANAQIGSSLTRVAHPDQGPRVGRSQGTGIFWGLVSVFFAAAACFYFWKNHENENSANKLRDEVLTLQDQRDTLNAQKEKLQAGISETESQLKTREDFLQDKEAKLAAEETRLEALAQQPQNQAQQNQAQATVIRKFNDMIRNLDKDLGTDVVERNGRPVLRVPNAVFFAPGDATLKPEGKTLLKQVAQALDGQLDNFELRIASYTDGDSDIQKSSADTPPIKSANEQKKESSQKPAPASDTASGPHYATGWELTAARAAAIERFYLNETSLPFNNVLVVGRGDSDPIVRGAKEDHTKNRRIEITIVPLPAPFHSPDPAKDKSASHAPVNPLTPPPDPPPASNQ